jgi:hypothetical protein
MLLQVPALVKCDLGQSPKELGMAMERIMNTAFVRSLLAAALFAAAIVTPASAELTPVDTTRYVSFVTRPEGVSHADFMAALTAQAVKAKTLSHPLRGLVISDVTQPANAGASQLDVDALVEVWTADEADHAALLATADGKRWHAGLDALYGKNSTYVSREYRFIVPKTRGGMRNVGLLVRKDGWSHADFMDHWLGIHGVMATKVDGLTGFVLNAIQRTEPSKGESVLQEIDGIAEVWDSLETWGSLSASPNARPKSDYFKAWVKDGNTFIQRDKSRNAAVMGTVVIPVND